MKSLQTTVDDKTSQTDELQITVENNGLHLEELQMQRERIRELEVTIQEIFDKTSQVEELQTLLKNKTKELESLQESKSHPVCNYNGISNLFCHYSI